MAFIHLNNAYGSETVLHSWAADVKEMYDWLPQDDIMLSIKWALSRIKQRYWRDHAFVYFLNSKCSHIGIDGDSVDGVNISFQMIYDVYSFEILNAYFLFNSTVFLQKLGIPIGAPGSPGASMCVCVFYEN